MVETLQFRVEDGDPGAAELKKINQAVRDFAQSFVPDSAGQWAEVYAYPCVGSTARTIVLKGNTFPAYGTDGTLLSWCWDVEDHRAVTLEEARAAAGWTDQEIQQAVTDYVYEHQEELGFSGAGGFNADWDVVGFRQRLDGGWDFFLQYHKTATADSDTYEYLLTFSDGAVLPGVAIPEVELAVIGCSLEGLSPYDTTGRVERTDALELLRSLEPADLLYLDETTDLTAEELAPALAAAAEKGWAHPGGRRHSGRLLERYRLSGGRTGRLEQRGRPSDPLRRTAGGLGVRDLLGRFLFRRRIPGGRQPVLAAPQCLGPGGHRGSGGPDRILGQSLGTDGEPPTGIAARQFLPKTCRIRRL